MLSQALPSSFKVIMNETITARLQAAGYYAAIDRRHIDRPTGQADVGDQQKAPQPILRAGLSRFACISR